MPEVRDAIRTEPGRRAYDRLLADPSHALVAFDFDGTLAPIVPRPEDARALPDAVGVLAGVAARVRRVAVVTGRPAGDAVLFGGLDAVPGLVVLGHYGLERWADGHLESPPDDPAVDVARETLRTLVAVAPAGTYLEDKGHSLAVHTRNTEDPAGALDGLRAEVSTLAANAGLEVVPGRYVLEVRPPGVDKGHALRDLVRAEGVSVVFFAGDDLGDVPAFDALDELRAEGLATLAVCADSPETPAAVRDSCDLVVDGPTGVLAVLASISE